MSMMASFKAKSVARGKRSGDGREGRSARLERAASIPGRATGEGMQAKAWSNTSFEKLKGTKDVNNCSSSTSPETNPGASSVFPFFTGVYGRRAGQEMLLTAPPFFGVGLCCGGLDYTFDLPSPPSVSLVM